MSTSTAAWSVPRLIPNGATQQLKSSTGGINGRYSPQDLLSRFNQSSTLTVKQSLKQNRFFMYEEHAHAKLHDDKLTPTITVPPNELATMLQSDRHKSHFRHYWTCPVASVAPTLLNEFQWHKQLHDVSEHPLLDPRGPSLWMGTSGSGTQCHYDVANNIIVQLYGSKRIRCFPPSAGVYNLHVFPDAHPRARKSQVDFDTNHHGTLQRTSFPHFVYVPRPTLDVILRPGDALEIPAFWFHHVENGHIPSNYDAKEQNNDDGDDAPSVSLNSFALSRPMMLAQKIFQKASQPLGRATVSADLISPTLKALGVTLIQGLNVVNNGKEKKFIRKYLLEARYSPLVNKSETSKTNIYNTQQESCDDTQILAKEQMQKVNSCIEQILPDFRLLVEGGGNDGTGIALLVALHLLELWAVELVGAEFVVKAWDEALS